MNLLFVLAFFKGKKKISHSKFEIKAFWKIFLKYFTGFQNNFCVNIEFYLEENGNIGSSYTPWKYQKISVFLMFSGGIGWEQWNGMGWLAVFIR